MDYEINASLIIKNTMSADKLLKHPIAQNILLLQGPVGYFFEEFRDYLLRNGAHKVIKVNYNAGDDFFYRQEPIIHFNRPFHILPEFYNKLLNDHEIDCVYLFGDCRFIHQSAIEIFKKRNIPYYVFEEGYIRPNYITIEMGGVNGHSAIKPKSINDIIRHQKDHATSQTTQNKSAPIGYGSFRKMVFWGFIYFSICRLLRDRYPFYIHHKSVAIYEIPIWIWSFIRKFLYKFPNYLTQKKILEKYPKKYFFVPLQVYNDAQIFKHSPFHDIPDFIDTVMVSFQEHAPKETLLVIKHHPLDRGHRHYKKFIKKRAKELRIAHRIFYIHEVHLPLMLRYARGVVTINSTLGFSALHHHTPVKVLGKAFYNIKGLTYHGDLNRFWTNPGKINTENYTAYKKYIIEKSQIIGSFYSKIFKNK